MLAVFARDPVIQIEALQSPHEFYLSLSGNDKGTVRRDSLAMVALILGDLGPSSAP
jgi:hypothetical protein